jgi:hypothetical protein
MSEDVNELQKEWRAIVLAKLTALENNQTELRRDIADMKGNYVTWTEYLTLKKEVEILKEFKTKAVTIIVAANAFAAVLGWALQIYFRHS